MLRLPHPDMARLISTVQRHIVTTRRSTVAATDLAYAVFHTDADTPDLAFYDTDGTIYVPQHLVTFDARFADLLAFHEHIEIGHKRAGHAHAYAHRRALVAELLAARLMLPEPAAWQGYLAWRIELYPPWKVPDPELVVAQLAGILSADTPRRGVLLQIITAHHL